MCKSNTVDPVTNDLVSARHKSRGWQKVVGHRDDFCSKICGLRRLAQCRANGGDMHPPLTGSHCGSKHPVVATLQCRFI